VTRDRRLGRGLAALLGETDTPVDQFNATNVPPTLKNDSTIENGGEPAMANPLTTNDPTTILLNVYEIDDNPFQPRRDFSEPEIVSLSESLKEHDMIQPIVVRKMGERFQLISGERRLRAAIHAGWSQVPARIREANDRLVAELAIVENLQRKDLNPIEKALSFRRYIHEHSCTQEDLAKRIKVDRSTIANLMRLLELPEQVRDALASNAISAGHARALLPLGDAPEQIAFCERICQEGLSVRDTERTVQTMIRESDEEPLGMVGSSDNPRPERQNKSQIEVLEQELRTAVGTRVDIRQSGKECGRIVIHFRSRQEFDRIRVHLTGQDSSSPTGAS